MSGGLLGRYQKIFLGDFCPLHGSCLLLTDAKLCEVSLLGPKDMKAPFVCNSSFNLEWLMVLRVLAGCASQERLDHE